MSITSFYTNQEIFITGGSGFLGKALIEKLLRSFSNFGKIYVLLRSKKGKTADERLQDVLNSAIFERARKEQPQAFANVFAIAGDCQELGLGISAGDLEKIKNVNLIFHSAASVRFDDHLQSAVLMNTRGTHELVKIATNLRKLRAFLHISTSYSNADRIYVEEKIYPGNADWRATIKLAENFDVETLNIFFSKYSCDQPNTYTFTKNLSEHIVNDYRHQLPIMIFRPSIVVGSTEEPVPGWVDNFNGPIGMLVACGAGILRTNHCNPDVVLDMIPVDVTIRSLLIAAYKLSTQTTNTGEVEVINCANNNINSLSIGEIINIGRREVHKNPFEKCLWTPNGSATRCLVWHLLRFFTLQIGFAIIVDMLLRLAKKKPFLLKLQRRIHAANKALYLFINTEWLFCNENFQNLEKLIPPEDIKKLSFLCYSSINHVEFLANGLRGAKKFLLNEPPESTKQARLRFKVMLVLDYFIKTTLIILIGKFLFNYLRTYFNTS